MKRIFRLLSVGVIILFLSACSTTYTIQIHPPLAKSPTIKKVAIFLDGTKNSRDSRTNVSTLNEIVQHQNKDNLYIFYNDGVGTDGRFLGAGTGWGFDKDVVEAYSFLSKYYTSGSKLYVFGFSRGAYTSRILAGMLYSVGVYDLSNFQEETRLKIAEELYDAYKGKDKKIEDIRKNAKAIIDEWASDINSQQTRNKPRPDYSVMIDVLGLWDTVEALGVIPTIEAIEGKILGIKDPQEIVNPNGRYIDQICNARNIYHALALDDNRANVFTPIIISSNQVAKKCKPEDSSISKIEEVWFSGAHADVGGGYSINENNNKGDETDHDLSLSGLSLNWMMSRIKIVAPELLPKHAEVFQNPLGYMHDAEKDSSLYVRVPRHNILVNYINLSKYHKLKVHSSVFDRLAESSDTRSKLGFDSEWYKLSEFSECFNVDECGKYKFKKCKNIEVVEELAKPNKAIRISGRISQKRK